MTDKVCDFCNAPRPLFKVPAGTFEIAQARSVGDWYACTQCAQLITHDQWNQLLRRVLRAWQRRHNVPFSPVVSETLRTTYEKLRENMTGPVQRI